MKKINILLILIVLLLTACSEASAQTPEASSGQEVTDATVVESSLVTDNTSSGPTTEPERDITLSILPTDYENAASVETQLLIGIYQLNETDLAVTAEQASSLIELLTTLKDSFTSQESPKERNEEPPQEGSGEQPQERIEDDSQEGIESLIIDAVSVLSDEQISSIASMQITQETALAVMEKLGFTMEGTQIGEGNAPGGGMQQRNPPAGGQQPQGDMAQGTPPADGGQMGGPGEGGRGGGGGFVSPELIEAIIEYLQGITS